MQSAPEEQAKASAGDRVEEFMGTVMDLFMTACGKVERVVAKLVEPLVEELAIIGRDIKTLVDQIDSPKLPEKRPEGWLSIRNLIDIFAGREHKHQLKELDTDSTVPENPEEQAARQQLLVGTGTVVVNIAAALFAPSLFLVGIAGIIYQLRFVILSSYRELVNEKRLNVYSLTTLMLAGTIASGSFAALTLATLSASLMRWLIAKTESAAQRSVASTFLKHPRSVWTIVGELEVEVDFEQVQVGDTIVVNAGQMIPMDGVIIQGAASIDQRMLTGESRLVDKGPGDPALANTMVLAGRIIIRVERSGGNSLAAQIARALAETQSYRQELRNRTEHQLDRLVPPLLAISALTLPIWGINSSLAIFWAVPRFRMMYLAPITMLSFMHLASLRGILLKNGRTLERMREVDIVVFDKTGTLTLEQPAAGQVFCFAALSEDEVVSRAVAAESGQNHPIALAIQELGKRRGLNSVSTQEAQVRVGFGVRVTIGEEQILVGSERMMVLSQVELGVEALRVQSEVHKSGNSLIFVAVGNNLVGAIEICPICRPGAAEMITDLHNSGKQVVVLSGDHEAPTRALSERLGIDRYFAQTLPEDKARIIEQFQKEGRVVCFVGDGINDSLALQRADVSVSMKGATAIATTVAQIVLMNGDTTQLTALFDLSARFEHYMRINRLSTGIPAFVILAGTLGFGWSFLTAVLIQQCSVPVALYSLLGPLAEFKPHASDAAAERAAQPPSIESAVKTHRETQRILPGVEDQKAP